MFRALSGSASLPLRSPATPPPITGFSYRERIGSGSMGEVYLAHDERLQRAVAIKLLKPELTANEIALSRFQREARALLEFDHPNIVKGYQIGRSGGRAFLVMEYLDGEDLSKRVKRDGALPVEEVISTTLMVCEALSYAASHGKLHRDIKPANLLRLHSDGTVKLVDFGLIKDELDASLTGEFALLGTPYYISPEAIESQSLDIRSDLYSLGATMIHLLQGVPCFHRRPIGEILTRHVTDDLPLPDFLSTSSVGQSLRTILCHLVSRDPARRYQHPNELQSALLELQEELKQEPGEITQNAPMPFKDNDPYAPPTRPASRSIAQEEQDPPPQSQLPRTLIRELREARAPLVHRRNLVEGEVLFYEGDPSDEFYILSEGRCEVLQSGRRLRVLEEGVCFGELAASLQEVRSATIRMLSSGEALYVRGTDFELLLERYPLLQSLLFKSSLRRLRDLSGRYSSLHQGLLEGRRLLRRHLCIREQQGDELQRSELSQLLVQLDHLNGDEPT